MAMPPFTRRRALPGVLTAATVGACVVACGASPRDGGGAAAAADTAPLPCPDFAPQSAAVTVHAAVLKEASGLAASRLNPGVLWSHNDAGAGARVVAFRSDGSLVAVVTLTGAASVDWEDMAIGAGPDGKDALFVADIGDNDERRSSVFVYRVTEPDLAASVPTTLGGVTGIELVYDDGEAHDAEAMFVDPRGGAIVVITKAPDGVSAIYAASPPFAAGARARLEKTGTVRIDGGVSSSPLITGASISRAGDLVLLRTYSSVLGFPRAPEQSVASALARAACPLPVALEKHGEAVALAPDGAGFYTVSEGASPPLSFATRR